MGGSGRVALRQAESSVGEAVSVEELLADGLNLAGASPVHLAIWGTPAADGVRCAWRGGARTAAQREDAIRFWLRLDADATMPDAVYLETLFAVVLDTLSTEFRETAKANFLAIARGGESMEYLFLTCFADYTVTNFLMETGTTPTTVTVAYDRMGEAAFYDLYVREHDTGTYESDCQRGHPSVADSVVNYDKTMLPSIDPMDAMNQDEPDCSPYPFDVMAVFALNQTRFSTSCACGAAG